VIKYNPSVWLPTSLMPQSNGDVVGNSNGNEMAGNKERNGENGKG
jgi:hypothetical protein